MMSRVWGLEDEDEAASWRQSATRTTVAQASNDENLPTFKAMLDEEWYTNNSNNQEGCFNVVEMKDFGYPSLVNAHPEPNNMLLQSINSSSSSPTSIFSLDPSQVQSFLSGTPHNSGGHGHCHAIPQSFLTDVAGSSSFDGNMELPCEGIAGNNGASAIINNNNNNNNSSTYVSSFGALFNPRNRASPLHSLSPRSPMGGFPGSSPHSQIATPNPSPHSQMVTPNLSPRLPINSNSSMSNNNNLCDQGFLNNNMSNLINNSGFGTGNGLNNLMNGGARSSLLVNRSKLLRPLEISPTMGAQPTLFQKRAALRHTLGSPSAPLSSSPFNSRSIEILDEESPTTNTNSANTGSSMKGKRKMLPMVGRKEEREGKHREDDDMEESNDGSGVHYDTDDGTNTNKPEETGDDCLISAGTNTGTPNNNHGGGGGAEKGKKKGLPAKNLMAERRRRKKLNDRLYMLRSVVPKISKMDRASILGDAIEYLRELLQRINDLHNELESTSQGPVLPGASSFNPVTPPALPCRVKEECPSSLPSPNAQPARVEVRTREGRALNIHMFCARRPGLLLSTMRALDGLGLDVQQAVISCFNGFALDVFRAEQSKEGDIPPEEIKAVLLHTAGCHTSI